MSFEIKDRDVGRGGVCMLVGYFMTIRYGKEFVNVRLIHTNHHGVYKVFD